MSHLSPEMDGTGGGYGRFQGIPIQQLAEKFQEIKQDPSFRSISAILRITREQLEARNGLSHYPLLTYVGLGFVTFFSVSHFFGMPKFQDVITKGFMASVLATVALSVGWISTRRSIRESRAQTAALKKLAIESLESILEHDEIRLKPLDFDQRKTVKDLIKTESNAEFLRRLLG